MSSDTECSSRKSNEMTLLIFIPWISLCVEGQTGIPRENDKLLGTRFACSSRCGRPWWCCKNVNVIDQRNPGLTEQPESNYISDEESLSKSVIPDRGFVPVQINRSVGQFNSIHTSSECEWLYFDSYDAAMFTRDINSLLYRSFLEDKLRLAWRLDREVFFTCTSNHPGFCHVEKSYQNTRIIHEIKAKKSRHNTCTGICVKNIFFGKIFACIERHLDLTLTTLPSILITPLAGRTSQSRRICCQRFPRSVLTSLMALFPQLQLLEVSRERNATRIFLERHVV